MPLVIEPLLFELATISKSSSNATLMHAAGIQLPGLPGKYQ